jgi:hypothetical protein
MRPPRQGSTRGLLAVAIALGLAAACGVSKFTVVGVSSTTDREGVTTETTTSRTVFGPDAGATTSTSATRTRAAAAAPGEPSPTLVK